LFWATFIVDVLEQKQLRAIIPLLIRKLRLLYFFSVFKNKNNDQKIINSAGDITLLLVQPGGCIRYTWPNFRLKTTCGFLPVKNALKGIYFIFIWTYMHECNCSNRRVPLYIFHYWLHPLKRKSKTLRTRNYRNCFLLIRNIQMRPGFCLQPDLCPLSKGINLRTVHR